VIIRQHRVDKGYLNTHLLQQNLQVVALIKAVPMKSAQSFILEPSPEVIIGNKTTNVHDECYCGHM
jgi:hypothetical protein